MEYSGPAEYRARFVRGGFQRTAPRRFASTKETVAEAAARLGLSPRALGMRFQYGWSEAQVLALPPFSRVRPTPKGVRRGARPGVKLTPLTKLEIMTLQLLADGIAARDLPRGRGPSVRAIYGRLHRMRLKLTAFTTAELVAEGFRRGLIT